MSSQKKTSLNVIPFDNIAILTCASKNSLEKYDRTYTDSTGIVPTSFFREKVVEEQNTAPDGAVLNTEYEWDPPR